MEKRTRCPPFTKEEKYILEEVVGLFSDTIENKRTDATSSRQKREAWVKITVTFNSYGNVTPRTAEQLRKAWENIKSNRRKKATKSTEHNEVTGNGVSQPDETEEPLLELVQPHFMNALELEYDSDAVHARSSAVAESTRPASALSSFAYLADARVLDEDAYGADADDRDPQSSQERNQPFLTVQIEDHAQNKSSISLGGGDEPVPHSSSAKDNYISRTSSRVASLPNHNVETPADSSGSAKRQSLPPSAGANSLSSAAKGRMAVLREEHAARMAQLATASRQRDELHGLKLREARAAVDAAESGARAECARARAEDAHARAENSRARAELARALDAEEELEYNRRRRRKTEAGRDRSPLP